jgi:hypothetical protein
MQVRKLPKVNASSHVRLQAATVAAEEDEHRGRKGKRGTEPGAAKALLDDARFSAFFEDEDFTVDERSATYKELNPNAGAPLST